MGTHRKCGGVDVGREVQGLVPEPRVVREVAGTQRPPLRSGAGAERGSASGSGDAQREQLRCGTGGRDTAVVVGMAAAAVAEQHQVMLWAKQVPVAAESAGWVQHKPQHRRLPSRVESPLPSPAQPSPAQVRPGQASSSQDLLLITFCSQVPLHLLLVTSCSPTHPQPAFPHTISHADLLCHPPPAPPSAAASPSPRRWRPQPGGSARCTAPAAKEEAGKQAQA